VRQEPGLGRQGWVWTGCKWLGVVSGLRLPRQTQQLGAALLYLGEGGYAGTSDLCGRVSSHDLTLLRF
jgi:hypothetical protein